NLATTLRRTLGASLDATILANQGASQPFRIGVWSPWTGSGYFVNFGPAPRNLVTLDTVTGGDAGSTLLGGHVVSSAVGHYEIDSTYHITFLVDRARGFISAVIAGNGANVTASLANAASPALFGNVQVSLTASEIGRAH